MNNRAIYIIILAFILMIIELWMGRRSFNKIVQCWKPLQLIEKLKKANLRITLFSWIIQTHKQK